MPILAFHAIRENAQRKSLDTSERFDLGCTVNHHAWKLWNFGDPATAFFTIKFDGKFISVLTGLFEKVGHPL